MSVRQDKKLRNAPLRPVKRFALACLLGTALAGFDLSAVQIASAQITGSQTAAGTNRPLKLAADSPFRDPDIIYLEADELINDETAQLLTAKGGVEGRYQDRTLRADEVIYNIKTGLVIATGNVVLVDATGASQYADKLELSDELEAGTAANFTARMPDGGVTAARFVTRTADEEIELYNAYYTACKICSDPDGKADKPSWRIKARKVKQDKDTKTVRYHDAIFEFMGVPILYTPYLAHPDPSAERGSGFLMPFIGVSNSKGFNTRTPYYWAINDHTEATITPRIYSKVNPLLEYQFARQFHTGRIDIEGSFTYGSIFDRNGNAFDDPSRFVNPDAGGPFGKRLRSHIYADGYFEPNATWTYGFGVQLASDDNYLNRYDLDETHETRGLYSPESRRNLNQAFIVGQNEDFRLAISAFGLQDLRSRISETASGDFFIRNVDDGILPVVAPKIEFERYFNDPLLGGRLKLSADTVMLTRETGTDYTRATTGLDYSKTFVAPGGIEVKPFANARFDYIQLDPQDASKFDFTRTLGQAGVDIRYPFIKPGENVNWILEPRAQITQSFGDGKNDRFDQDPSLSTDNLFQDARNEDLDQALLWQSNKSTGFDFWQEGLRADIGGAVRAEWGRQSHAELFLGQSYFNGPDDAPAVNDFQLGSGLTGDKSDIVGQVSFDLGGQIRSKTRLRFDDDENKVRRIESSLYYRNDWLNLSGRYYKINSALRDNIAANPIFDLTPPPEEISGSIGVKIKDNWRVNYYASHDIDANVTRSQRLGLAFQDDCTMVEILYTRQDFNNDAIRNQNGIGIRVSLLTLGEFGG